MCRFLDLYSNTNLEMHQLYVATLFRMHGAQMALTLMKTNAITMQCISSICNRL